MFLIFFFAILVSHLAEGGGPPAGPKKPIFPPDDGKIKMKVVYKPANCSKKAKDGDMLSTEYVGYFRNGGKFDSTYDRNQPMKFTLGAGDVVKGAEMDSRDMCVGEIHHTEMPPSLAYGNDDYGQIPGGSWLVFDSTLIKIEKGESFTFEPMDFGAMPIWT